MTSINGQTENRIVETLKDEMTVGYVPQLPLEAMWASGSDMPQITLRRDIEFMQMHPIVATALDYYKSGVQGAEFWGGPSGQKDETGTDPGKPISMDPRVSQFVLSHVERFWQRGVPVYQEGYAYGWSPGEHIYKENSGMLMWSHLKGFHPNDGFVLTCDRVPVGLRIKSIRTALSPYRVSTDNETSYSRPAVGYGGTVDLWFASGYIPAKAAWYPHRPRFNQFYGRSQLIGAWRPWRRLAWRDALEQVIDAACFRAGYRGPIIRYPPGHSAPTAKQGVPATTLDSESLSRRENRDVARQYCEWAKAGASFGLSSERDQNGQYKWDVDWPEHVMDVRPLIEAARYLEDQVMLGIGVPPELLRPGGTGSGYSGRSVPRETFLTGQQKVADAMLQGFVEQVLKPLVLWNFGDVPFEISCKPLLKSYTLEKQGEGSPPSGSGESGGTGAGRVKNFNRSQAARDAWALRKQKGTAHQPAYQQATAQQALSLEITHKVEPSAALSNTVTPTTTKKPEEETDASELLGQPEVSSGATWENPTKSTKVERRNKSRNKHKRRRKSSALRRVAGKWV